MNAALCHPASETERDARPVLVTAPLRDGFRREDLSRFGDPVWDVSAAIFRPNAVTGLARAHFGTIDDPSIERTCREFLFARLNVAMPTLRPVLAPSSLAPTFFSVRSFCDHVRGALGRFDLDAVDHALIDDYAAQLIKVAKLQPPTIANRLSCVLQLYEFRRHMPSGGLAFDPFRGRTPGAIAGLKHRNDENSTPRFPEEIIQPLIAWALRYVTVFSKDILAARSELDQLEARRAKLIAADAKRSRAKRGERILARLTDYIEMRAERGRGVPVWSAQPWSLRRLGPAEPLCINLLHLELVAGAPKNHHLFRQDKSPVMDFLNAAVERHGIELGAIDAEIAINADTGAPWRPRFDSVSLLLEERMLQTACYILCAYLTGMRDSEVQAMRHGCLSVSRSADGLIDRYRVRSTCFKQRGPGGDSEDWVTIEPVAKAIEVLERLTATARRERNIETLWPVLHDYGRVGANICEAISRYLNHFAERVNDAFGEDAPIIPPGPDGRPWRLSTRQFRRTIAWHIANRPFGTVAGMIQYKQTSVAAFEGYAGVSRSGFRAEVETARELGRMESVLGYFEERQDGGSIGGPGAARIGAALDAAHDHLEPGAITADRGRLRRLLADLARTFHVGPLADCFFDPDRARCLQQIGKPQANQPLLTLCEPTQCANACITRRHAPAWTHARDDARALLREKRLSPLQRTALEGDAARMQAVLDCIGGAEQTESPREIDSRGPDCEGRLSRRSK